MGEKSTGKEQKITIKNDKGRLSQDEIDRMVDEAERYKAEDEANRVRVEAKNSLENYCYSMKNTMSDEKLASKLSDDDKSTVTAKIDETTSWLDANQARRRPQGGLREAHELGCRRPVHKTRRRHSHQRGPAHPGHHRRRRGERERRLRAESVGVSRFSRPFFLLLCLELGGVHVRCYDSRRLRLSLKVGRVDCVIGV